MKTMVIKLALLGCSALASQAAGAQAAAPSEDEGEAAGQPADPSPTPIDESAARGGGEIVVTARRREERLQDVPVAVTALDSVGIERMGVTGVQDIRRIAPSTNVSQSAGGGRQIPLFTIRGQRQGDTLSSVDPSVGVYIGDVLFKRTFGLDQISFDLGAVEIQKGAQGTLFGLNVTGGNIIFRPNLPTDELEASVLVGIGNFDNRKIEGYFNLPIAEGIALRVAGRYEKRDGYMHVSSSDGSPLIRHEFDGEKFVSTPSGTHEDAQDLDGGAVRVTLKLEPTPELQSIFTGNYIRSSTNGSGFKLKALVQPSTLSFFYTPEQLEAGVAASEALPFYQAHSNVRSYAKTRPAWNIANTTSYQLSDAVTIKNIIGYREYKTVNFENIDGSDLRIMEYGTDQDGREFSEEFQLLGEADELDWIVGAYFHQEKVKGYSFTASLISPAFDFFRTPFNVYDNVKNTTKSIFGSATQELGNIVDGLSLTLGGRYTWDTREAEFGTIYQIGTAAESCGFEASVTDAPDNPYNFDPATCLVNLRTKFSKFTYTATLDWKVNQDLLLYFSNRKGYRAGGFGTRATGAAGLVPFRPDTVTDFEIGAKFSHRFDAGAALSANAALFRSNYSDIQRLVPVLNPDNTVSTNVANAAKARIQGFELETTFQPNDYFELSGFLSHVDPRYRSFIIFDAASGTNVDVADEADFAGVPRWQYGVSGRVNVPLGDRVGEGALQLTYYHQSAFSIQDRPYHAVLGQTPGYGLLNGRAEWNGIGGANVNAAIFVNNLLDKKYRVADYSLESEVGFASYIVGPPRMYGLEVRFTY